MTRQQAKEWRDFFRGQLRNECLQSQSNQDQSDSECEKLPSDKAKLLCILKLLIADTFHQEFQRKNDKRLQEWKMQCLYANLFLIQWQPHIQAQDEMKQALVLDQLMFWLFSQGLKIKESIPFNLRDAFSECKELAPFLLFLMEYPMYQDLLQEVKLYLAQISEHSQRQLEMWMKIFFLCS